MKVGPLTRPQVTFYAFTVLLCFVTGFIFVYSRLTDNLIKYNGKIICRNICPMNQPDSDWKKTINIKNETIKFEGEKLFSDQPLKTTTSHKGVPQCLARNICLMFRNVQIYGYGRDDYFNFMLKSPMNTSNETNHVEEVVPRIVHFIRFTNKVEHFKFYELLAMIAADRFVPEPKRIYFWHNNLPKGEYWTEALYKINDLYLVRREPLREFRYRVIEMPEIVADITRLEVLLEYGGIYLDLDTLLLRSVQEFLKYDVTMGREIYAGLYNGILFSKPWSKFLRLWYRQYSTYNDNKLPFTLNKKHPYLVHTVDRFDIFPHRQEYSLLYDQGSSWNWRVKNHAIHLFIRKTLLPDPTPKNITSMNTVVGEIMRYIYYGHASLWRNNTLVNDSETAVPRPVASVRPGRYRYRKIKSTTEPLVAFNRHEHNTTTIRPTVYRHNENNFTTVRSVEIEQYAPKSTVRSTTRYHDGIKNTTAQPAAPEHIETENKTVRPHANGRREVNSTTVRPGE